MSTSAIDANDITAIKAVQDSVAVYDRDPLGRIKITDDDRLRFLHNQSTNDIVQLKPGQGCDTVFVNSTARTIDLVTVYIQEDAVLLLVSPNRREFLMQWLDRYIFFADKVQLTDVTQETATFSLIGPESDAVMNKLGAGTIIGQPYGTHVLIPQKSGSFIAAVGSGLANPGYTLILSVGDRLQVWHQLAEAGVVTISDRAWDTLRILQGRPVPDRELTEDYNPLEAGLWHTLSFTKGCYIGQETIARLNTYKGVKQQLWGIRLSGPTSGESTITIGEEKVGKLTSYTETTDGYFGLGYIRSKAGGAGLKVNVGEVEGEIVEVPYVSHEYPQV